jgi:hypothetical protein
MVSFQIIPDPAVSFVRVLLVDLLDFLRDPFIFQDSFSEISLEPFVVSRPGYVQNITA